MTTLNDFKLYENRSDLEKHNRDAFQKLLAESNDMVITDALIYFMTNGDNDYCVSWGNHIMAFSRGIRVFYNY